MLQNILIAVVTAMIESRRRKHYFKTSFSQEDFWQRRLYLKNIFIMKAIGKLLSSSGMCARLIMQDSVAEEKH